MDRGEAYGSSGRETTLNPSNTEGAPGIPSSYTGKTIIGLTVALPWQVFIEWSEERSVHSVGHVGGGGAIDLGDSLLVTRRD